MSKYLAKAKAYVKNPANEKRLILGGITVLLILAVLFS